MRWLAVLIVARSASAAAAPCDLPDEAAHFHRWQLGWTVTYGALSAGQTGLALARWNPLGTYDRAFRDTLITGAVKSGLGLLGMLLAPSIDETTTCEQAGTIERTLFWGGLAGNVIVNVTGGLILAHETTWSTGLVSVALGLPVGLLNTYTLPGARGRRCGSYRWRTVSRSPVRFRYARAGLQLRS